MLSVLCLLIGLIVSINGFPYRLDDELSVERSLQRRGSPIVCDAEHSGEIVFLFDTADGTDDFDAEKAYVSDVAKFLPDNGKIRVSGIVYGGQSTTVLDPTPPKSYDELVQAIEAINKEEHGPRNEHIAIAAAEELANADPGEVKVIVLFVDGSAADAAAAKAAADAVRNENGKVFLAFPKSLYSSLKSELKTIAAEPYYQSLNPMNSLVLAESLGLEFGMKYNCP